MENLEKFKVPAKMNNFFLGLIGIGLTTLIVGFIVDPARAWAGMLVLGFYLMTIGLFGGFFTSMHFISGSKWSVVLRRVSESMFYVLIAAAVFLGIVVIFGMHHLYEWSHEEVMANDQILQKKAAYLNRPFFIARVIVYFVSWFAMGTMLRKYSLKQDGNTDKPSRGVLSAISAGWMIIFVYFLELCSIDLIMSLEPHWSTTMFPMYTFAGLVCSGFGVLIILTATIQKHGGLKSMTPEHFHDLGKFQFAFVGFWAYIAFCQHMLTWYANLPEETVYLERRLHGIWGGYTAFLWVGHFIIPFLILLSSKIKRNPNQLAKVSWWIVFMGFVDVVWLVYGGIQHENIHGYPFKWMEMGLFLGAIGIIGYSVLNAYAKVHPEPTGDPFYQESVHFHQKH
ncbi:MAG: hypothetical protein OEV66_01375 [Spirochaetia bacterium]|nr:hypothetical protein [Spirochaetia bacterium]